MPRRRALPAALATAADPPTSAAKPATPWWRRWLRGLLPVAVVVLALLTVRDQIPGLDEIRPVIAGGDLGWVGVAVAAEIASMAMFARQHIWLLRGVGVRVGLGSTLALAYTRSALAISMPAGTAVSAGFAYRSFRRWGAGREAATAVIIMSSVCSFSALVLLYLVGFQFALLSAPLATWRDQPAMTVAVLAVTAAVAVLLHRGRGRRRDLVSRDHAVDVPRPVDAGSGLLRRSAARVGQMLREVATVAATMPSRYPATALGFAAVNWLFDLACLVAVAQAFHLPLNLLQLGTAYVVAQLVRQIPITPGGMGVIEATLLAALTGAGAAPAAAAATVLGYRLLSCWLVIPAGLTTWAFIRRADEPAALGQPDGPGPAADARLELTR